MKSAFSSITVGSLVRVDGKVAEVDARQGGAVRVKFNDGTDKIVAAGSLAKVRSNKDVARFWDERRRAALAAAKPAQPLSPSEILERQADELLAQAS